MKPSIDTIPLSDYNLSRDTDMQILLTNDDGIFAPGLAALYKELVKMGDVTVVAPADSRSGASHSVHSPGR